MTNPQPHSAPPPGDGAVCPTCGGRGALRQGDESCRTCLDCLGQGRVPGFPAATTTAAVLNQGVLLQKTLEPVQPQAECRVKDASTFAAK